MGCVMMNKLDWGGGWGGLLAQRWGEWKKNKKKQCD